MQVCDHPCLVPDYESAGSQGSLAASGKLVVLDKLLHHLQAHAHKTLLLSHHPQVCKLPDSQHRPLELTHVSVVLSWQGSVCIEPCQQHLQRGMYAYMGATAFCGG